MRTRGITATAIVFVLLLGLVSTTSAQNLVRTNFGAKHRTLFGFKAGIINQTDFKATAITEKGITTEYRTRVGLTFQIFFDIPVNSWLFNSLSIDIHDVHVVDERHQMLNLGLSLKYPIYKESSDLAWRPLVGIGYSYLAQGYALNESSFTTMKAGIEGIFYSHRRHAFLGELVVFSSLSGSNKNHDISFGPVVLIRFGVIY